MKRLKLILATCPKPFIDEFKDIQINSIKSWKAMSHPHIDTDIYIFGDDYLVKEHAILLDCKHIGKNKIEYNKFGTPLVSSIFQNIKEIALNDNTSNSIVICCYINSDIITFDCFLENIYRFHYQFNPEFFDLINTNVNQSISNKTPYLLIGNRWDTNGVKPIDFKNNWKESLINYAIENGESHGCTGIDYFIFSPNTFKYIYPFALGKFVWDRWLVGNVYRKDSITIDISNTNFVIHQNSPWYQSGKCNYNRKELYETEEVNINHSFDYYEKDVYTGTRWESNFDISCNKIVFIPKNNIPKHD